MTSANKIRANRANSKASTGPRAKRGKRLAAQNAFRHGLCSPIFADPTCVAEVENMVREIAGSNVTSEILELARGIAEAHLDLQRVRQARLTLLTRDYKAGNSFSALRISEAYEKSVHIFFSDCTKQLMALDRYERRALSRRKFAIRALDALRRDATA